MKQLIFTIILIFSLLIGCNNNNDNDAVEQLHIAAASNLIHVFTELGEQFEAEHNIELVFSFSSSGQLSDQIINGAPYDIYTPASTDYLDTINSKGLLLDENYLTYAFGTVGFSTLKSSSVRVETFDDLLNEDVVKVAIANPEHAPYGFAAKQALEQAGIWEEVKDKLVYGRNIADTLALLQTENVEAAIIAVSLKNDEKITFVPINEHFHTPLDHAVGILSGTMNEKAAQKFIDFIFSEKGQQTIMNYGYAIP